MIGSAVLSPWKVEAKAPPAFAHACELPGEALERLLMEIIARAVLDAMWKGLSTWERENDVDIEARAWLYSETCAEYCAALGFDHARIGAWVNAGCPEPPQSMLEIEEKREKHQLHGFAAGLNWI